jgi:hypothetical protein
MFSNEAKLWYVSSKWDPETRQLYSAEEAKPAKFLADYDKMNHTDEPTATKPRIVVTNPSKIFTSKTQLFPRDNDLMSNFQPRANRHSTSVSTTFTSVVYWNLP